MKTFEDIKKWKTGRRNISIEEQLLDQTRKLGWDKTDVLYSFLGIYVIGLRVFYPDIFERTSYLVKAPDGTNVYSNHYVFGTDNCLEYHELNNLSRLKDFIEIYDTIGNIIPIWPGGNIDRGRSYCFDIPDIYFKKNEKMSKALISVYQYSFMENIVENPKEWNTDQLLEMTIDDYISFLTHIIEIINYRNHELEKILNPIN